MSVIELHGVCKSYGKGSSFVEILHGIDLTIEQGEFVAITGRSGSGKSTIMNIIGLLDIADEGVYTLNNQPIQQIDDIALSYMRLSKIGFVFQNFNLIPSITIFDNVQLPMIYNKLKVAERKIKVKQLLEYFGLADKMHYYPNQLSGGQQQRVAIARALVNNPSLILADEPTGNLDSATGEAIIELLEGLNRQGTTIVMVTHDENLARKTQRIVTIKDGSLIYDSKNQVNAVGLQPAITQQPQSTTTIQPAQQAATTQPIIITPTPQPPQQTVDQNNNYRASQQ